ncbi:hypothetical protein [Pseudalkalibacillus sp. JSM 102089]|uniref:hypothetical protein n=1 Tax=Pseudalkalibacillus sp. JSM 102089 TaxID=3229856 RepID=UPI003523AB38
MKRYKEVQRIKEILEVDGINYGRVMATELYNEKKIYLIKIMLEALFYDYILNFNNKGSNTLVEFSTDLYKRKDYDYIVDNYLKFLPEQTVLKVNKRLSMSGVIFKFFNSVRYFIKISNKTTLKKIDKIKVSLLLVKYMKLNTLIEEAIKTRDIILCTTFCDAHPIGNLLVQICKKYKITTATLQHGQYRFLQPGKETPDAEAYKNFISDYMFSWGQATVDEFKKSEVNESRFLKVGAIKPFSFDNGSFIEESQNGVFGVILNGETYNESNYSLLKNASEIAESLNMKYIVRFHPKNNQNKYKSLLRSNRIIKTVKNINGKKFLEEVDFSLIHMSGVYVEMLSYNAPFFVLDDKYTEQIFKDDILTFSNLKQFMVKYRYFQENTNSYKERLFRRYTYFNKLGSTEENYKNAHDNIIQNLSEVRKDENV